MLHEALVSFNGGESKCLHRLPVMRDSIDLGFHDVPMHSDGCGVVVTAMPQNTAAHESHLVRLLKPLQLRGWQWINIHHREMRLITISR
jgi:hypothetical protein